jgi:hypothetical protein
MLKTLINDLFIQAGGGQTEGSSSKSAKWSVSRLIFRWQLFSEAKNVGNKLTARLHEP